MCEYLWQFILLERYLIMINKKSNQKQIVLNNFTSDLINICDTLFNSGPIKYFNYARYYNNGSIYCISTMPNWYEYYISNPKFVMTATNTVMSADKIILWNTHFQDILAVARTNFCLEQPIVIIKDCNSFYREIYCFACKHDLSKKKNTNSLIEYYFNNIDKLKGFIFYFNNNGKHLHHVIDKAMKEDAEKNLLENKNTKISGIISFNKNRLTIRETDCYLHLLRGLNIKEIGKALNISARTVETHLLSIKNKLNCYSRSSLFKKALTFGLIDVNIFRDIITN